MYMETRFASVCCVHSFEDKVRWYPVKTESSFEASDQCRLLSSKRTHRYLVLNSINCTHHEGALMPSRGSPNALPV